MNVPLKLTAETAAMMAIGDGVLLMVQPRRHLQLWNTGPEPWRSFVAFLEQRPVLTMAIGAASVALGVWMASGLHRDDEADYDHLGMEAHVPSTAWQDYDAVVH